MAPADGAFCAYVDVSDYYVDSMEFANRMLAETGAAVAPGLEFDPANGHRVIQMSFAGAAVVIAGALDALGCWLPGQHP